MYLYQYTNKIGLKYIRFNYFKIILIYVNIEKIKIVENKYQMIQKFQVPNILGNSIIYVISNVSDISYIKHLKIPEIFWMFDIEVLGIKIS